MSDGPIGLVMGVIKDFLSTAVFSCYSSAMPIEWTSIYRRFKGLWVALADDERTVIASGKTAKKAMEKAKRKGHALPIIAHMPDRLNSYVG